MQEDDTSNPRRLENELLLLSAAYPTDLLYTPPTRELKFTAPATTSKNTLVLRIPDDYPSTRLPTVVSASAGSGAENVDLRDRVMEELHSLSLGEEVLDLIFAAWGDLVSSLPTAPKDDKTSTGAMPAKEEEVKTQTTLIWTHHLLALSKRKQALTPPSPLISGITKPGYPGVMIFSGPATAVREHVDGLKQQNWQAFQVRLEEEDTAWVFSHGAGVREVETMGEIVQALDEEKKKVFLEAMRMK